MDLGRSGRYSEINVRRQSGSGGLRRSAKKLNKPRPIGFWHGFRQETLPHPKGLVRKDWISEDEESRLIAYLLDGDTYETYRGLSHCRFGCDGGLGYRELTDGVWVWPEGLYHYPESHDVMLPEEFIEHCRMNEWNVPENASQAVAHPVDFDFGAWIDWARCNTKQAEQDVDDQATAVVDSKS